MYVPGCRNHDCEETDDNPIELAAGLGSNGMELLDFGEKAQGHQSLSGRLIGEYGGQGRLPSLSLAANLGVASSTQVGPPDLAAATSGPASCVSGRNRSNSSQPIAR